MIRFIKKLFCIVAFLFLGLGLYRMAESVINRPTGPALVVLDPGHGGEAPGAVYEGVLEKDLNLAVALKAKALLEGEPDLEVLLTWEGDETVTLEDRAALANDKRAALLVSIHANALEGDAAFQGILTLSQPQEGESAALAAAIQKQVSEQTGGTDLGTRTEDLAVTRLTEAPACLLEMGFMTNPEELAALQDETYQNKIAQGIRDGILAYLG